VIATPWQHRRPTFERVRTPVPAGVARSHSALTGLPSITNHGLISTCPCRISIVKLAPFGPDITVLACLSSVRRSLETVRVSSP
jgi:hypothetical protein